MSGSFTYTGKEWLPVARELSKWNLPVKLRLEEEAARFLAQPTPEAHRQWFKQRWNKLERIGALAHELSEALSAYGWNIWHPYDEYFDSYLEPIDISELLFDISHVAGDEMYGKHDDEHLPGGRADPWRAKYLQALCEFWDRELRKPVGASVNQDGMATGPMVRFLSAAASPVLIRGEREPLGRGGARTTIRDYQRSEQRREQLRRNSGLNAEERQRFEKHFAEFMEIWRNDTIKMARQFAILKRRKLMSHAIPRDSMRGHANGQDR